MKNTWKRFIALILAMAMSLSLLGANVWAAEESADGSVSAQSSEEAAPEEESSEETPEEPSEDASEPEETPEAAEDESAPVEAQSEPEDAPEKVAETVEDASASAEEEARPEESAEDVPEAQPETGIEAVVPMTAVETVNVSLTGTYGQTEARSMLAMINDFRTGDDAWILDESNKQVSVTGLDTLTYDYDLERTAMLRAAEIALKFAHVRPNGTMCSTAFSSSVPGAMGENIYMSHYSPASAQQAFTTWQETDKDYAGQGHRRNMLSSNFKTVGIGHFRVGIYDCWVQDFGGGVVDGTATAANDQSTEVNLEVDKSQVADLTVTPDNSSLTMQVSQSQSLPSVTVSAKLFNKSFTLNNVPEWSVTGDAVSLSNGQIVAEKAGEATLTATVDLGEGISQSAQVSVSVTQPDASGKCGDFLTWTLAQGTLTISGHERMNDWYNVLEIPWYDYRDSIQAAVIEDGVDSIGEGAFQDCASLESVTIPDSTTIIGKYAFQGCASLKSVTIPYNVTSIGEGTFQGCASLESVTIPDGVTSIGPHTFQGCASLESVTIPDGVTSIGLHTFQGCASLESVTIPDNVTSIGSYAFRDCASLESVTIPDGVTSIEYSTFCDCARLKRVTIPDSVTSIGGEAFQGCASLESVTIPDNVTSIGDWAFADCISLQSVTIPDNVTSIGEGTFEGCTSLKSVTIPDGVTSIGENAFLYCGSPESVTIPGSVQSIGEKAFGYRWNENSQKEEPIPGFTIRGVLASAAQTYAEANRFAFVDLNHTHNWGNGTVTTPATCKSEGVRTYNCTGCGASDPRPIAKDPTNHVGGTEIRNRKAATCGAAGYTGDTYCLGCGVKRSSGKTISATGEHTWDKGTVTKPATTTTEGVRTYTCKVCKKKKTERIAKLPKSGNSITCKDSFTKNTDEKKEQSFTLKATANGAPLLYHSDTRQVTVSSKGKVTIQKGFMGKATITITAAETEKFRSAKKKVTVSVRPVVSVKVDKKKKTTTVSWTKSAAGKAYMVEIAQKKDFKKTTQKKSVKWTKAIKGTVVKGLKPGTYFVRVRLKSSKQYSDWSNVRSFTVTK